MLTYMPNTAIRRKYPTDININTESTGAESLTIIGWVLFALNAELDTGNGDESNAWRLLRAHERNTRW